MTTDSKQEFFEKVESLRKHMVLNISQLTELMGVSRMSYYGWLKGKPIRKNSEDKVKKTVKNLLFVMKEYDWPTAEVVAMESKDRFERLKSILANL